MSPGTWDTGEDRQLLEREPAAQHAEGTRSPSAVRPSLPPPALGQTVPLEFLGPQALQRDGKEERRWPAWMSCVSCVVVEGMGGW